MYKNALPFGEGAPKGRERKNGLFRQKNRLESRLFLPPSPEGKAFLLESVAGFQQAAKGLVGFLVGKKPREPFVHRQSLQAQLQLA